MPLRRMIAWRHLFLPEVPGCSARWNINARSAISRMGMMESDHGQGHIVVADRHPDPGDHHIVAIVPMMAD
jgi:hypothetical protein